MHATAVLQKLLRRSIPSLHLKRLTTLVAVVGSALQGGRLTLSALGRSLNGGCAVRHRIKRVDRLLGNTHLHQDRLLFYRCLCDLLLAGRPEPILIVDWSDLRPDRRLQVLRASVWVHGFALTIYEEVHPLRRQNSPRVHHDFLLTLRMLLPEHCRPVIVADAGFRSTWFQQLDSMGWHWVGRIRGRTLVEMAPESWVRCTTLGARATGSPRALGPHRVVRARPVLCGLYLYRKAALGRRRKTLLGQRASCRHSLVCSAREREPWLLGASLSLADRSALEIVQIYRLRMRIEHSFRTLKSHQFGFAFEDSQSRGAERIAVLLLVQALALLLAWIAGWAAQRTGLQHQLKSNADRRHTSMSIITLGCYALSMLQLHLSDHDVASAVRTHPPLAFSPRRAGI